MSDRYPTGPYPNRKQGDVSIYALIDPETGLIRYVGKAADPVKRLRYHLAESGLNRTWSQRWIAGLKRRGLRPTLQVLEVVPDAEWPERERHWIAFHRAAGAPLTNICDGGNGAPGMKHSRATKKSLSVYFKAIRKKIPHTPESEAKLRAFHESRRGVPHSEAWRRKISKGKRGLKFTLWHRASIRRAQLKRYSDPAQREACSRRQARLTDEQVVEIYRLAMEGQVSQLTIARRFGTRQSVVAEIKKGIRYPFVPRPDIPESESAYWEWANGRKARILALYGQGLSVREIAALTGAPRGSVKRIIVKAGVVRTITASADQPLLWTEEDP